MNTSSNSSSHASRDDHATTAHERLHGCADEDDAESLVDSDWGDAEVAVEVRGKRWYVSGVTPGTTAEEVTAALTSSLHGDGENGGWSLCERWRGVCRPLSPRVLVLDVCRVWGLTPYQPPPHLTQDDDVGLCLRYIDDDSGRESCTEAGDSSYQSSRRNKLNHNYSRLKHVIATQSHTIHRQIDKLRERERQIGELEFEEHMSRVHKHGDNYLLDAYFRSTEGGNSDSGVGGLEGNTKPYRNKHRSRRSRHLLREHYLTKELTDICQVNSTMIKQTPPADEQNERVYVMEKIAIINKRLQREEELLVRLESKIKRYTNEATTDDQVTAEIKQLDKKIDDNRKNIENFDKDLLLLEDEIQRRNDLLMTMYDELKKLDAEHSQLETEPLDFCIENYEISPDDILLINKDNTYKLDTLV